MLLTYDGFALPYSHLTQFGQESTYEESNTDKVTTKFDVRVQCILNMNHLALIRPDDSALGAFVDGANAATLIAALREKLLRPRRSLSVKVNGQEMIPNPTGGPGTVDARNGPQPRYCNVLKVTSETCLLDYAIEAQYVENLTNPADRLGNRQSQSLLYNRWSEYVMIDDVGASTRTRSGKFEVRSDNLPGQIPDQFRDQFAVLSLPPGMLRQSQKYTAGEDGLSLSYEIVDKEVFKYPPKGAYKAVGKYRETAQGKNACLRYAEADVTLYGPPVNGPNGTNQAKLLYMAMQVVGYKLALASAHVAPPSIIIIPENQLATAQSVTAEVDMYNNVVRYRVLARFSGNKRKGRAGIVGLRDAMCQTPYSEADGVQPTYFNRGTANLLVQAASYFDPAAFNQTLTPKGAYAQSNPAQTGVLRVQQNDGLRPGEAGKTKEP